MISNRNINVSTLRGCPIGTSTTFEMRGARHQMVFDGKVEDVVFRQLLEPDSSFRDLNELAPLMRDPSGNVASARAVLNNPKVEKVSIDVGKGSQWEMRRSNVSPDAVELTNPNSGMFHPEQVVTLAGPYVYLRTQPTFTGPNESIMQQVVGMFNPANGTITCVHEEIQRTTTTNG
jgi:hypothetical protein